MSWKTLHARLPCLHEDLCCSAWAIDLDQPIPSADCFLGGRKRWADWCSAVFCDFPFAWSSSVPFVFSCLGVSMLVAGFVSYSNLTRSKSSWWYSVRASGTCAGKAVSFCCCTCLFLPPFPVWGTSGATIFRTFCLFEQEVYNLIQTLWDSHIGRLARILFF